jgi:hypothetical protein
MLESTRHSLQKADRTFHELKAAYHAAHMEDLAEEASEVLDGTKWWSRQDCIEFRKELNWELQAFYEGNTSLSCPSCQCLRAERLDAAVHCAKQVVERALWDYNYRWRESQRLRLDHHQLLHTDESWGQGGRQRAQASPANDGRGGPQKVMQTACNN